jgi:hypothetical protein
MIAAFFIRIAGKLVPERHRCRDQLPGRAQRQEAIAKEGESDAAKPPEARAVVPPTTIACRCAQLRRTYSSEQLGKMPAYQEKCR